jgi:hypothetical protein
MPVVVNCRFYGNVCKGRNMNLESRIPLLIFLASLVTLAFEVLLTRVFSITLWYHFAFMVVSIAMLGLAASGTLLALFPGIKRLDQIGWYLLALGIALPGGFILANLVPFDPVRLAWERTELLNILLTYIFLSLPFFCAGLVIATAFSVESERAGLLYGADLVGAGIGSLGVLPLMGAIPPEQVVLLFSLVAAFAAGLAGGWRLKGAACLLAAAVISLLILHPDFIRPRISPYKGLEAALRYPGAEHLRTHHTPFARIDTFRSPAVRYAPGLSLRYLERLPEQIGISIDGGDVNAVTDAGEPAALAFLDDLPAALPYAMGNRQQVLALDPLGGLPVLMARRNGAERVATVESTPDLLRVIRDDFRDFSGDLYGGEIRSGLGRSWLAGEAGRFDLIDLTHQGAQPAGAFGIGEDYRFTVEAFREYLGHLTDDGLLCVNLFIIPPPRTELRILATLAAALEETGVREAWRHVAAIRSWGTVTIVAKRTPLVPAEIGAVRRFGQERRFDLAWLPGASASESNLYVRTRDADYFRAFRAILTPAERESFLSAYLFDVRPVRDEAPFFSLFLRLDRMPEIYRTMGSKWQFFLEEGYLLPAVFVQVLVIGLVLVCLPLLAEKKSEKEKGRGETGVPGALVLLYFAMLGLAYMFVEMALIQKLILPLEQPPVAVATVLAALLVSSGCGSLLGQRFPRLERPAALLVLAFLVLLCAVFLPWLIDLVQPWPLPYRGLFFCLLTALPGSLMGIPFPAGLRLLGRTAPGLIPWAWTVNGAVSVLAPLLAVMTAMAVGFRGVLLLGATAYFLAFLLFGRELRQSG